MKIGSAFKFSVEKMKAELGKSLIKDGLMTHSSDPSFSKENENRTAASEEGLCIFPTSFAQQRLWLLDELESGSAYNFHTGLRLTGRIDVSALEKALKEIVRRHEALRTTFRSAGGRPVQVIADNMLFEMPLVDLSGQPDPDREAEAERLVKDAAMHRFNLGKGPLFCAALIRLSEEKHILLLTMHHIVVDEWSMGVLAYELAALYKAFSKGEVSPLPELPIQYADFAHWQREWLQGEVLENHLSYWRKQLKGVRVLQMPTDHPRPAVQTYRGACQSLLLSATLTDALKDLSQTEGTTLFITLLAAFNTLLYRHSGQEDIVVGSPIANRNRAEIEGLIGFFVNSLAMRTNLSGNPTFRELIRRVQGAALGAYEHQDLPFEKLVEELNPERDISHTPLFQVMFNMTHVRDIAFELHNLSVERLPSIESESKFDFTLYVVENASGIGMRLVYNTDLFDSWRMAQMLSQYQTLLAAIVSDPNQRISELSLLKEAERHQILVDWNDKAADYPEDQCIHTLFEAMAEHAPEAGAVIFGNEQLSYHELNCRANQLAHYLRLRGIGPEQVVAICMERSLEMVIGLLAILKAGGAYVALEPDFPGARLLFMLEDTQPGLLLTQERFLARIPEYSMAVVCLDRDGELFAHEQVSNLEPITTAEDLAYVTYTSGSTGKPKGILTSHRNVVQNLHALIRNYSLNATDIVLQLPSFSYDASVRDMFGPLLAGARIVVVRNDEVKDPSALVAKIAENHVTCILSIVPSLLTQLVEAGSQEDFSFAAFRHISVAGEPLPMALCKKVQDLFGCNVVNQYGPSECTMISSYHRVDNFDGNRNIALIGRPLANSQFYILDEYLNPVPVGVAGEAYIGGLGVSRGYLNLPELTAEKFVPHPFSNAPGARLYNTGDLLRYLPDGTMEFLGRRDFQVKLRGFRIELGEVEATLRLHPAVSEAVVVAREDRPGDKRLVAYVVAPAAERGPSTGELRTFLQERLPDYMIPAALLYLDALPLTANRKVDRRALPVPDERRPDLDQRFAAPRTPAEKVLAKIWGEVLGLERVGVHDNFFELGGHSLLATQVMSRARDHFEMELPLLRLFKTPTITGLSELIETIRLTERDSRSDREATTNDREVGEI
ncbi:MAG: amino acid adenylation domain-containing protein [Desulfobacterales bacterium]